MSQTDARNHEDVEVGWPLLCEEELTPSSLLQLKH
jgi:hypothetical protein